MANRIAGITVTINGDTTGLSKALETVNKTIKDTQAQLKDTERLLKLDPSHTELLSQKQEKLKTAITATKEKLDALKTAQEQAKAQMESGDLGKDKYDALQREIIATEEELKRLAKEAAEANTALNKIEQAGKTMESVGNKMSSAGSSLTRNVTTPILAVGAAAVKTTMDFDAEMSKVSAISGATGEDFDKLRAKAREMGARTKFSATEAAQAFEYMAMAGWKDVDMLDGIEGIMNLAAASGEDLALTSDIVTDALTAFGLKAEKSGHFADVLAAASSNANTNVAMLGESFKYAAPVAGAMGISAEDTSLALGLMANAGIKASQSGTALRTGLTNLAKPTKQMKSYMKKYNVSLIENDNGSINLRETMVSLREKMGSLSESEQAAAVSAIFGKNSMAGWLAIINASDEDFNKLTGAIDHCDGSAEKMAATMQDNLAGQITILKSALQELMIQIGDALMPTIRNIVSHIQSFVEKLQQMDEGTRNTIIRIAAFAAAIGPVLLVVGKLTTGIGKGLQAFSSLGKGILTFINQAKLGVGAGGKLAAAISGISAPVLAVIAAVGLLVAAFVHLWNTNEEFRNKVIGIWESVKAKFSAMAEKITSLINSLGFDFKDLGEAISAAWDWLCNALEPIVTAVLQSVGDAIESVIDVVGGVIQVIVGLIKGFKDGDWTAFLTGISDLFTGVINALLIPFRAVLSLFGIELGKFDGDWGAVWEKVKTTFETIWNAISGFFSGIWEGLKTIVTTVGTAIGTEVSTAWNTVKTVFETVWNGISLFFGNIWTGIVTTVTTTMESIKTSVSTGWNTIKTTTETIWNGTKTFVSTTWENIRTAVGGFVDSIKEKVSTVWDSMKTTVSTIMEGLKTGISEKWEAAKTAVSTTVDNIKSGVSEKWEATKTAVATTVDGIKTGLSEKWEAAKLAVSTTVEGIKTGVTGTWESIQAALTPVVEGIKTNITSAWDSAQTSVGTALEGISSKVSTVWDGVKTNITDAVTNVKTSITTGFTAAKTTVATIFEGIRSKISTVMTSAKTAVTDAISRIKSAFKFTWSLPQLKLPHISISGSFSLRPPRVPHFSISWYKKAMDDGMILNSPTIFGQKGNTLLAGGEAGSEAVVGTQSLMEMIRNAVASMANQTTINYGGVNINVYQKENQDIRALADEIEYRINNSVMRRRAAVGT